MKVIVAVTVASLGIASAFVAPTAFRPASPSLKVRAYICGWAAQSIAPL